MRCPRAFPSLALLLVSACAQLPPRPELPVESAVAVGTDSQLDTLLEPAEQQHAGASGFRLMSEGPEAFAVRAHTGRLAGRTLDVQTYIWHDDVVGRFLAQLLLDAADRGVRVRLLLDDLDARAKNDALAALAAHPNIGVRMFNPLASRAGTLAKIGEFMTSAKRLNHRMHNKSWIADNRIAIVGGRNIGEEYFGASADANFVDLEFVMVGPVVRDASASFDGYWNSAAVYPIATLSPTAVSAAALAELRLKLGPVVEEAKTGRYAELLRRDDAVRRFIEGDWPATWSSDYHFVSDDPLKALREPGANRSDVLTVLQPVLQGAQHDLTLISPYFVPGKKGTAALTDIAKGGPRVRILTNSLAANDVAAVHGGYAEYRKPLLEGGIGIWELKPLPGVKASYTLFGSKKASLHTKALEVDGRQLFVGSYNLDPRSTALNCEQGVLVTSPELSMQLDALFAEQSSPAHSWRVSLADGQLSWTDGSSTFTRDPLARFGQRFLAWLSGILPIETQL
jgi:cardiolipin synthase C